MKVCFTGGGSAGHLFPALQVDAELVLRSQTHLFPYQRFWIGRYSQRERDWVAQNNIPYYSIQSGKLRRYFAWENMSDLFRIIGGFFQALKILRVERPDCLFSKGGFVSVPVVLAATLLKIPTLTHESDLSLGLANRINARFVTALCLSWQPSYTMLSARFQKKSYITGVPVRFNKEELTPNIAQSELQLVDGQQLILILGGSLGATQLNELVWNSLETLTKTAIVVHQTGDHPLPIAPPARYHSYPFIEQELLGSLLAVATLVVSRSGATTIAELLECEKPMLLLPLSHATSRGDQVENAQFLVAEEAALLLPEDVDKECFVATIHQVLTNKSLQNRLSLQCSRIKSHDAQERLADIVLELGGI